MRWFIDQRNNVTKQKPFKLEKGIIVNVYLPDKITTIVDDRLTIENDISFESICIVLKEILLRYKKHYDVYFSVALSFRENGNEIDIYNKIKEGILVMNKFILSIIADYPCSCERCKQIKDKINKCLSEVTGKEISFVWDCSLENGEIVFGSTSIMLMGKSNFDVLPVDEIKTLLKGSPFEAEDGQISTIFHKFMLMHLFCYKEQNLELMPTFMLIFEDGTFPLIPFLGTVKTTFYRMISKITKIVREKNVVAVFYTGEYYCYSIDDFKKFQCNYNERIKHAEKTIFTCVMAVKEPESSLSINIDSSKIDDRTYVSKQISSPETIETLTWFAPIYQSLHSN
jgi:hypothetical protein